MVYRFFTIMHLQELSGYRKCSFRNGLNYMHLNDLISQFEMLESKTMRSEFLRAHYLWKLGDTQIQEEPTI